MRPALLLLAGLAGCDKPAGGKPAAADSDPGPLPDHTFYVTPYVQSPTPESAWIVWITDEGEESRVEWGLTEALGEVAEGEAETEGGLGVVHEVLLEGLTPGADVWYRAHTDAAASDLLRFRAPPAPGDDRDFVVLAMSDMQRDDAHPDKFAEVLHEGVIPYVTEVYGPDLPASLGLALLPGDLVENGWDYLDWWGQFFAPAAPLMAQVPFFPVLGNHEAGTPLYYRYFHLPQDGTPGYEERWWSADHGNLRVVGLDSNSPDLGDVQLAWLDEVAAATCTDDDIDFLFAQLHHPSQSELWTPGEEDLSGQVIQRLEAFSADCDRPSLLLFGHTHGYSRGQSMEHRHAMVNVATAGGAIDPWSEADSVDYEAFTVTQDEWGFVLIAVSGGDDPAFELTRVSRGDASAPLDNAVRDSLRVRRRDAAPDAPEAAWPVGEAVAGEALLVASAFSDPDGDLQGAARWQVAASCDDFSAPAADAWVQHENWWWDEDLQAGDDLTDHAVGGLAPGAWCWRVRYRDRGLTWSAWSEPAPFTVTEETP